MKEDENSDVRLALEEMRIAHDQIFKSGDIIDQKTNTILVAAGLIIALTTSVKISLGLTSSLLSWIFFIVAISFYLFAVIWTLIGAKPTTYKLPIAAKWEVLDEHIFGETERDVILSLLRAYTDQIQYNEAINKRKSKNYLRSMISLILSVLLIISLIVFSI